MDHLMDLMSRSLVVVGKKGSNGAMKTFHILDLLRDLCLRRRVFPQIYTTTINTVIHVLILKKSVYRIPTFAQHKCL